MRQLLVMFVTIFLAELGDKTQVATLLFASERRVAPFMVFAAAAGALVLGSALSVLAGSIGSRYLHAVPLKLIAGIGFIAIGAWTLWEYFRGAPA